jgi:hypothetical protein
LGREAKRKRSVGIEARRRCGPAREDWRDLLRVRQVYDCALRREERLQALAEELEQVAGLRGAPEVAAQVGGAVLERRALAEQQALHPGVEARARSHHHDRHHQRERRLGECRVHLCRGQARHAGHGDQEPRDEDHR